MNNDEHDTTNVIKFPERPMMEMYAWGHHVGVTCGFSGFLANNPARCLEIAQNRSSIYMTPRHKRSWLRGWDDGLVEGCSQRLDYEKQKAGKATKKQL